jgi:hypothetical protein
MDQAMKIVIFSDTKTIVNLFPPLKKGGSDSYEVFPSAQCAKLIKKLDPGSLVYLDATSFKAALLKTLAALRKRDDISTAVIDPKGSVLDPAQLFHCGAADYIGKDLVKKKFSAQRFKIVTDFSDVMHECFTEDSGKNAIPHSGSDWKQVRSGKEYMFCFLFVELDRGSNIKTSQFGGQNKNPADLFKKYVETQLKGSGGKVWMWMDYSGLILFPFDGKSCSAVTPLLKLILNRSIFVVNESIFNQMLSFRIALHIGSTVYRDRGDTGKIVSDTINFIFHLGQKRADPGSVYVSEDVQAMIPPTLTGLFSDAGEYEGRKIFRMKRLADKGL